MTDPAATRRRPRFERFPPPPFELTVRDCAILLEVQRHRLLRSDHISTLLGAPHKKICDRLSRLFHAGYLDRPRAQIAYHIKGGGSTSLVYAIGARALPHVASAGGRSHDTGDVGRMFLAHALAVADFRVSLRLATRGQTTWRLLDGSEIRREPRQGSQSKQLGWRVTIAGGVPVPVVPDYAFSLRHSDGRTHNYLVEIDRGTMPITRVSLHQTSVMRKLLAYDAMRRSSLLLRDLGWRNFRVLILTSTRERAGNIHSQIAQSSIAVSPLFLVTHALDLDTMDVLASRWRDSTGKSHTLI